jgi:hypothetical protein
LCDEDESAVSPENVHCKALGREGVGGEYNG